MSKDGNRKIVVLMAAVFAVVCAGSVWAQERTGVVQGVVKSSSGAPVSGAFVKLKNAEKRLTFMVISQAQGRYTAKNLPSGKYVVQGIGNGFQSDWSQPVEVNGRPAAVDVSLTAAQAPTLPNAWPGRPPGDIGGEGGAGAAPPNLPDGPGKQTALTKCSVCHTAARLVGFRADQERWKQTIEDMRMYMQASTQSVNLTDPEAAVLLDYVVKNFAEGAAGRPLRPKPDPNSRLPRTPLTGAATQYMAVEFEIPSANTEPHEVTVDSDGNGWVTQRRGGKLGRLDPRTLTYTEVSTPSAESKTVSLNAIWSGPQNKLWFLDVGPNRRWYAYDTKTREFNVFPMTTKLRMGGAGGNTMRQHPNGTVWYNAIGSNTVIRLDPKTKEFTSFEVPSGVKAGRSAAPYGMAIGGDGKIYVAENAMDKIARVDPLTGKMDEFDIPVKNAVPRKGGPDADGNVWFGLHGAGKLLKIDVKSGKMSVYQPPTENAGVYAVSVDLKRNLVWFAEQQADKLGRYDPKTEIFTEFPLISAESDHRRLEVDQSNPNRIWWSGNDSNKIGYIEVVN